MTRDEILGLGAGRVMDAHVAENVMGWKYCDPLSDLGTEEDSPPPDNGVGTNPKNERVYFPHYSTDIAAAWLVVERLGRQKLRLVLVETLELGESAWGALFRHEVLDFNKIVSWDSYQHASTAALAICRAALAATPSPPAASPPAVLQPPA